MSNAALAESLVATAKSNERPSLLPCWVTSAEDARRAAKSDDGRIVWIVSKTDLAEQIVREVAHRRISRRVGQILCLRMIRSPLLPALENRFTKVAFVSSALPKEELKAVLNATNRTERFVGGTLDDRSKVITLWRGDLRPIVVPFDAFQPTANGIRPRFDNFSVSDYGATLKFGGYEASADAVLYEYDADFRRRMRQRRLAADRTLGASIRRLRMQRQLSQRDFKGIDAKTIARIESGLVKRPQSATLKTIAETLGVSTEELGTF